MDRLDLCALADRGLNGNSHIDQSDTKLHPANASQRFLAFVKSNQQHRVLLWVGPGFLYEQASAPADVSRPDSWLTQPAVIRNAGGQLAKVQNGPYKSTRQCQINRRAVFP